MSHHSGEAARALSAEAVYVDAVRPRVLSLESIMSSDSRVASKRTSLEAANKLRVDYSFVGERRSRVLRTRTRREPTRPGVAQRCHKSSLADSVAQPWRKPKNRTCPTLSIRPFACRATWLSARGARMYDQCLPRTVHQSRASSIDTGPPASEEGATELGRRMRRRSAGKLRGASVRRRLSRCNTTRAPWEERLAATL